MPSLKIGLSIVASVFFFFSSKQYQFMRLCVTSTAETFGGVYERWSLVGQSFLLSVSLVIEFSES